MFNLFSFFFLSFFKFLSIQGYCIPPVRIFLPIDALRSVSLLTINCFDCLLMYICCPILIVTVRGQTLGIVALQSLLLEY